MLHIFFNYTELHRLKEAVFVLHMVNVGLMTSSPIWWPRQNFFFVIVSLYVASQTLTISTELELGLKMVIILTAFYQLVI